MKTIRELLPLALNTAGSGFSFLHRKAAGASSRPYCKAAGTRGEPYHEASETNSKRRRKAAGTLSKNPYRKEGKTRNGPYHQVAPAVTKGPRPTADGFIARMLSRKAAAANSTKPRSASDVFIVKAPPRKTAGIFNSLRHVSALPVTYAKEKWKVLSACMAVALVLAAGGYMLTSVLRENRDLKNRLDVLSIQNKQQRSLLNEKVSEMQALKDKEALISRNIADFSDKYREMAETYLKEQVSVIQTSRSVDRNSKSFVSDMKVLKSMLDNLKALDGSKGISSSDLSDIGKKLDAYLKQLPTLWPASGPISSGFGDRVDPLSGHSTSVHTGIDIAAGYGGAIKAAASGTVIFCGWRASYGRTVVIDHGNGLTTLYGHTSAIAVKAGKKVEKGQKIACVGSSGRSTGPHLHFEVRINDTPVNPLDYLDKK